MLRGLKREVWEANLTLVRQGLVTLTWGNVSGLDRRKGILAIKPSGVSYARLRPEHIVLVDLDGKAVERGLRPSCDTPTHLALYRAFPDIGGVTHTHSTFATAFAQACRPIVCRGTTHADHFAGDVPVTRFLTRGEVRRDYVGNTGRLIAERFRRLDYHELPGVLVAGHAPFTWGRDAAESVANSVALEKVAEMALFTLVVRRPPPLLPQHILEKHFRRKHGPGATYGQSGKSGCR